MYLTIAAFFQALGFALVRYSCMGEEEGMCKIVRWDGDGEVWRVMERYEW